MQEVFIWLAILTFFLVAEAVTVQLTTIWFAGGALVAALAAGMGAEEWLQILLFLAVSLILTVAFSVQFSREHFYPYPAYNTGTEYGAGYNE